MLRLAYLTAAAALGFAAAPAVAQTYYYGGYYGGSCYGDGIPIPLSVACEEARAADPYGLRRQRLQRRIYEANHPRTAGAREYQRRAREAWGR